MSRARDPVVNERTTHTQGTAGWGTHMIITLTEVSKGRRGSALPQTSIEYVSSRASLAVAETAQRPSVLGLIASGRMHPDTGRVTIDGETDYRQMRRRIALIDAPDVNDPSTELTIADVVSEELMFAGRPAGPVATRRAIDDLGYNDWRGWSIGTVPAIVRVRLLTELATMRPDVEAIVLTAPDRHGGDPADWWRCSRELAARGYAVLAIAGVASATALGLHVVAGGIFHSPALEATGPEALDSARDHLALEGDESDESDHLAVERDREVAEERGRPGESDPSDYTAQDADINAQDDTPEARS